MKTSRKLCAAAVAFATAMSISAAASATVYAVDYQASGVWTAYDDGNESYGVRFRSDQGRDGFWLVATDGENPKGDGSSHAILYGDLNANRITAYTYNGENSSDSFENGTLLGTYDNVFSSGGEHPVHGYETTVFSLDVSGINNALGADFDGIQIGEQAGIWFHQSAGSDFTYGADGSIADYAFDSQVYLDRGRDATRANRAVDCAVGVGGAPAFFDNCGATQLAGGTAGVGANTGGGSVPAPGGLALILVGLAGLGRKFRKKA